MNTKTTNTTEEIYDNKAENSSDYSVCEGSQDMEKLFKLFQIFMKVDKRLKITKKSNEQLSRNIERGT